MNWRVIFYRSASGKCHIEKFVEDLSVEDAEEVVASIAALRKDYFVRVKGGDNG